MNGIGPEKAAAMSLEVLDTRMGYEVQEVRDLLAAWGPDGRRIYLYLAVIDTLIFPFCYASLVAGVLHFLATQLEEILPWSALVVYWPWVVATLDLMENAGHVTLLHLFGHAQGHTDRFETAVKIASMCNQAKWNSLSLGGLFMFLEVLVWVWVSMGFSQASPSKRRREKDE